MYEANRPRTPRNCVNLQKTTLRNVRGSVKVGYQVTPFGLRLALFVTRVQARLFRPGVALLAPATARDNSPLRAAFDRVERAIDTWCAEAKLVA